MTAKTSISPSAHATTVGADASAPPSVSGSAQAPSIDAACQRARSSSTQKRSRRPGPQVVAASPRGAPVIGAASMSLIANDDTKSRTMPAGSAGRQRVHAAAARERLAVLDLDARVDRLRGRDEQSAEAPAPGRDGWLRAGSELCAPRSRGLLEQIVQVLRCHVGSEWIHGEYDLSVSCCVGWVR